MKPLIFYIHSTNIRTLCILSGIVFVVDSADKEGLPEAKEELHTILNNNKLAGVPLMIMANKQDLQGNSYHLHYIIYTSQVNIVFSKGIFK